MTDKLITLVIKFYDWVANLKENKKMSKFATDAHKISDLRNKRK